MKRVLITGANSFLGDNTKKYLEEHGGYNVDILDMLDQNWRNTDFFQYDVVFNVCAIVHRFDNPDDSIYFKINKDLAIEIAIKSKSSGVKQFIQMSTDGVFGIELGEINSSKGFNPKTPYEESKYEADIELENLRDESFDVCIIRPPMIYGNGCKGNFPKLVDFALRSPVFPSRKNKRDMVYVENICDFIKYAIDNELNETCYPRDAEPIVVCEMIKEIATLNGKKIHLWGLFNPFVALFYKSSHKLRSVFGEYHCTERVCSKEWVPPFSMDAALKKMYLE